MDKPYLGRVTVYQPKKGFRYAVDAYILCDFAAKTLDRAEAGGLKVLEFGSGTGIVSFGLALHKKTAEVVGIEIVPELVELAKRGARDSALDNKVKFICGNYKNVSALGLAPGSFDIAVSNPPYRKPGSGHVGNDFARAVARHEIEATLGELVESAAKLLKKNGSLCVITVPDRLVELLDYCKRCGLAPVRKKFAHPRAGEAPAMVLVEAKKCESAEFVEEPPLIINAESEKYTEEMKLIFQGPK